MALESILIPYDGSDEADAMLRVACDVVVGKRRVIVLYVTRVPSTLPLDPLPASFDRVGNVALNHAEAVAWHHGVTVETMLTRARQPVEAIVGEACDQSVDAIFMPLRRGRLPWHNLLLSRTARAVMRKAPCPVLLGRQGSLSYQPPWRRVDSSNDAVTISLPVAQHTL